MIELISNLDHQAGMEIWWKDLAIDLQDLMQRPIHHAGTSLQ